MATVKEWQERGLELEREGFEITVIGRQGRLEDERVRAMVRGAAAVRITIDLQGDSPKDSTTGISPDAVTALSRAMAQLVMKAVARAKDDHRDFITQKDVEEAARS